MFKVNIKGRKISLDEIAYELEESCLSTEDQIEALSQVLTHGVLKDALGWSKIGSFTIKVWKLKVFRIKVFST